MVARVVEGCGRVKNGLVGKVEYFGDVEGYACGALDASLYFLGHC